MELQEADGCVASSRGSRRRRSSQLLEESEGESPAYLKSSALQQQYSEEEVSEREPSHEEVGAQKSQRANDQVVLKRPLATVAADGWTPYEGKVVSIADFGVFVDFGCEKLGMLPRTGSQAIDTDALDQLNIGTQVTVYVTHLSRDTGKINLGLTPKRVPQTRIWSVLADGRTPYEGTVSNHASFGTFFSIGTECQALLPDICDEESMPIGSTHTIYVISKRETTGKLVCSLSPAPVPKSHLRHLVADGRTPYQGIVESVDPNIGAFIDVGCEASVVLPLSGEAYGGTTSDAESKAAEEEVRELQVGQEVTVYVIVQTRHNNKVTVSLKPTPKKLIPWEAMVCDGQTKIKATVLNRTEWGTFFDIGCAQRGLLSAREVDNKALYDSLEYGQKVPVYLHTKCRRTGKISLRLNRAPVPRERWEAIVTDGQFPYQGKVLGRSWHGLFVDIGAEMNGLVKATQGLSKHPELAKYNIGDELTVYVVEKRADSGHLTMSIERSDEPLIDWTDLIADGQTKYKGTVTFVAGNGAYINIGCNRAGLLPKTEDRSGLEEGCTVEELDNLEVGQEVEVYLVRRNLSVGRLVFSLRPTPTPRLVLEDVLADPDKSYRGIVYSLDYHYAHMDFGCEAGAILDRNQAPPDLLIGRGAFVKVVDFDDDMGKVVVELARPHPPPLPKS